MSEPKPEYVTPPQSEPATKTPKPTVERQRKAGQTWFPTITKNRVFASLVLFIAGMAVVALLILVALAFFAKDPPTQMQTELARICYYLITAAFSTLLGLLGGRAAAPDQIESGKKPTPSRRK